MADNVKNAGKEMNDIGFPEFTGKLITNTFEALVSANLQQMESYGELLKSVGSSLQEFIKNTSDSISDEEIVRMLGATLGTTEIGPTTQLTKGQYEGLNTAVGIKELAVTPWKEGDPVPNTVKVPASKTAKETTSSTASDANSLQPAMGQEGVNEIYSAVANRIAANRYDLLKDMVKAGMLRLVVDNGEILSRMTFSAWDTSETKDENTKSLHRTTTGSLKAGVVGSMFGISGKIKSTGIRCNTAKVSHFDRSGSEVNIFGQVKINFHTDYMPLNA